MACNGDVCSVEEMQKQFYDSKMTETSNEDYPNEHNQVREFMKTAGQPLPEKPITDLFDGKHEETIKFRMSLIEEEYKEIKQAIADKNFSEVIDGLADLLYVAQGMIATLGVTAEAFDRVHKANMSKFCKTEQEAKDTVEEYKDRFAKGKSPYANVSYRLVNGYYVIYNDGKKVLKSINWAEPNYDYLTK